MSSDGSETSVGKTARGYLPHRYKLTTVAGSFPSARGVWKNNFAGIRFDLKEVMRLSKKHETEQETSAQAFTLCFSAWPICQQPI
eukprot:scaffold281560_cov18-Prasinocladus_malaysianus.AAC.1